MVVQTDVQTVVQWVAQTVVQKAVRMAEQKVVQSAGPWVGLLAGWKDFQMAGQRAGSMVAQKVRQIDGLPEGCSDG